jgi:hypothetical protein
MLMTFFADIEEEYQNLYGNTKYPEYPKHS